MEETNEKRKGFFVLLHASGAGNELDCYRDWERQVPTVCAIGVICGMPSMPPDK